MIGYNGGTLLDIAPPPPAARVVVKSFIYPADQHLDLTPRPAFEAATSSPLQASSSPPALQSPCQPLGLLTLVHYVLVKLRLIHSSVSLPYPE